MSLNTMQENAKSRIALIAVGIGIALALVLAAFVGDGAGEEDSPVLAVINGETITKDDLVQRLIAAHGEAQLNQMVDEILLQQRADAAGITISRDAIAAQIAEYREFYGPEQWAMFLAQEGLSESELINVRYYQELVFALVSDDIAVTPEEIDEIYEAQADQWGDMDEAFVKAQIESVLAQQKYVSAVNNLFIDMRGSADYACYLEEHGMHFTIDMDLGAARAADSERDADAAEEEAPATDDAE